MFISGFIAFSPFLILWRCVSHTNCALTGGGSNSRTGVTQEIEEATLTIITEVTEDIRAIETVKIEAAVQCWKISEILLF